MNSIWLLFTAWLFSGILGFFLGVLAGKKRGGIMDRIVTGYSLFVASTPAFWVAMVLLMVFAVKLHWFPIGFSVPIGMDAGQISIADRIRHAILPAAASASREFPPSPCTRGKSSSRSWRATMCCSREPEASRTGRSYVVMDFGTFFCRP